MQQEVTDVASKTTNRMAGGMMAGGLRGGLRGGSDRVESQPPLLSYKLRHSLAVGTCQPPHASLLGCPGKEDVPVPDPYTGPL